MPNSRAAIEKLPADGCHFGFAEYLSLVDLLALAKASNNFNRFAETNIFPFYTVLDMNDPRDFPPDTCLQEDQDLWPILDKIGKYVHTVALRGDLLKSKFSLNVDYVLNACRNLRKLHLDGFNIDPQNIPFQSTNCWMIKQNKDCAGDFKLATYFTNPVSMIKDNETFENQAADVIIVQSDFIFRLQRFNLFSADDESIDVYTYFYVTELMNNDVYIDNMDWSEVKHLHILKPLNRTLLNYMSSKRFPKLRRLSANYTNTKSTEGVCENVNSLYIFGILQELHLIADNQQISRLIKKILTDSWTSKKQNNYHLHVFVYNIYEDCRRRWLAPNGYSAKCQLPVWSEMRCTWTPCPERHVVNPL